MFQTFCLSDLEGMNRCIRISLMGREASVARIISRHADSRQAVGEALLQKKRNGQDWLCQEESGCLCKGSDRQSVESEERLCCSSCPFFSDSFYCLQNLRRKIGVIRFFPEDFVFFVGSQGYWPRGRDVERR